MLCVLDRVAKPCLLCYITLSDLRVLSPLLSGLYSLGKPKQNEWKCFLFSLYLLKPQDKYNSRAK